MYLTTAVLSFSTRCFSMNGLCADFNRWCVNSSHNVSLTNKAPRRLHWIRIRTKNYLSEFWRIYLIKTNTCVYMCAVTLLPLFSYEFARTCQFSCEQVCAFAGVESVDLGMDCENLIQKTFYHRLEVCHMIFRITAPVVRSRKNIFLRIRTNSYPM